MAELSELQRAIIQRLKDPNRLHHRRWPDASDTVQVTRMLAGTPVATTATEVVRALEALAQAGLAERVATTSGHRRLAVWWLTPAGMAHEG